MVQEHFKQLNLNESTVHYFRKRYLTEVAKRAKVGDSSAVTKLDTVKCGRKVALGEPLDAEIKRYIQCLRENGTAVSVRLVQAAAKGYLLGCDCTVLVEYGGHVCLMLNWACSLLKRMDYVKRKASTKANSKLPVNKFQQIKASFLQQTVGLVKAHACYSSRADYQPW